MKNIFIAALLGALSAAAAAQTPAPVEEVRVSGARIELPEELANIWVDQFDEIKGTYRLSNGRNMQLSLWGNGMYAKIDGMERTRLVAVTPFVFVARNLSMKIRVNDPEQSTGPITADVILGEPRLAGGPEPVMTRLTASR